MLDLFFYFQEKTKSKMIALFRYLSKINAFLSLAEQFKNEQNTNKNNTIKRTFYTLKSI